MMKLLIFKTKAEKLKLLELEVCRLRADRDILNDKIKQCRKRIMAKISKKEQEEARKIMKEIEEEVTKNSTKFTEKQWVEKIRAFFKNFRR